MKESERQPEVAVFESEISRQMVIDALTRGAKFYNKYNIREVFNSDPEIQENYFVTCFARYYLLKIGSEEERFLKDPETEAMGKRSIFGRLIGLLGEIHKASDSAVQTLNLFAQAQEKDIVEKQASALENASPLDKESISKRFIFPSQIEGAANFMTTVLIIDKPKNMKQAIEGIKNRYKTTGS